MLVAGGVLILKLISIRFDAVLNVNILFVTGGRVRKGLFQLVDRLLRKACDPTGIKRPWACISFIRGTSLRLDAW